MIPNRYDKSMKDVRIVNNLNRIFLKTFNKFIKAYPGSDLGEGGEGAGPLISVRRKTVFFEKNKILFFFLEMNANFDNTI